MSTWRQKRELDELRRRDPAAYERVMAARNNALGALGKFDNNLQEMRTLLASNPVRQKLVVDVLVFKLIFRSPQKISFL
jgi:hypothetical protein